MALEKLDVFELNSEFGTTTFQEAFEETSKSINEFIKGMNGLDFHSHLSYMLFLSGEYIYTPPTSISINPIIGRIRPLLYGKSMFEPAMISTLKGNESLLVALDPNLVQNVPTLIRQDWDLKSKRFRINNPIFILEKRLKPNYALEPTLLDFDEESLLSLKNDFPEIGPVEYPVCH